jgi:hypothetical protein
MGKKVAYKIALIWICWIMIWRILFYEQLVYSEISVGV